MNTKTTSNTEGPSGPITHTDVLNEALKGVIQELTIHNDGIAHVVFIHNVSYNNGLQIDYSTESTDPNIPEWVNKAVQAQITEVETKHNLTRNRKWWQRILDLFA